jgi:hypothetical protein
VRRDGGGLSSPLATERWRDGIDPHSAGPAARLIPLLLLPRHWRAFPTIGMLSW